MPLPSPSPRPIRDSVERVVQRLEEEKKDPCRRARAEGKPCFPISTVIRGPEISVRDSLRELLPADGPSPNRPPTAAEMAPFRPGPGGQVIPIVTFDPGCVAKSALKKLKGKNDVYYLYRLKDAHGERVALYERPLDVARFQGAVEFLGRFDNECDALAAYRREHRRTPP